MNQTADYVREYAGLWNPGGGLCRVRIFEEEGIAPVIVCSQVPASRGTSIQGVAEYLAAEVIVDHPRLYTAHAPPFVWVEHFPRAPEEERWGMREKFSLVTFASYEIRTSHNRGSRGMRPKFGAPPAWAEIPREALQAVIGAPLVEEAGDPERSGKPR